MGKEPSLLRFTALIAFFGAILYGVWFFSHTTQDAETSLGSNRQADIARVASDDMSPIDRLFSKVHTDAEPIIEPPEITGDSDADERIRDIAIQRDYKQWPLYSGELEEIEGVWVSRKIVEDWRDFAARAEELDVVLVLDEGYVSFEQVRSEFMERLQDRAHDEIGREYSVEQIRGGTADATINAVLREYPIPGYTPHHSGHVLRVKSESQDFLAAHAQEFNFELNEDPKETDYVLLVWMDEKGGGQ